MADVDLDRAEQLARLILDPREAHLAEEISEAVFALVARVRELIDAGDQLAADADAHIDAAHRGDDPNRYVTTGLAFDGSVAHWRTVTNHQETTP